MDLNFTNLDRACSNVGEYHQFNSTKTLRFSPGITIMIYITYLLPFCFGVFGNISVCLIFYQQKKLRSITNTFLMNLCLNDLIVLCVSIPMTLSAALLEHWIFGAFLCKLVNFAPTVTALVSTFTVAVIAVERWFFIVIKRKFDRRCTLITLLLLWLVSIIIAIPEFTSRQIEESFPSTFLQEMMKTYTSLLKMTNETNMLNNHYLMKSPCKMKKTYYCVLKPGLSMRIFSYIVITVQYLVPFVFVSISCYSISRFLKRRMIRMRSYQNHYHPARNSIKDLRKKPSNITDLSTEHDVTSHEDLTTITNEKKSNHFLSRFRQTLQNREQYTLNFADQQHMLRCQSHTKRRFRRSRKLLIYVAALFTISWLPLTIVQICLEHYQEFLMKRYGPNFVYGYLLIPCYLISSLSAWINPVIYNYINRSFRREFYSLYSCCFKVSTTNFRKELTLIGTKRHRPEASHMERINIALIPRSPIKQGNQVVSFAGETTVMMHRQN